MPLHHGDGGLAGADNQLHCVVVAFVVLVISVAVGDSVGWIEVTSWSYSGFSCRFRNSMIRVSSPSEM